MQNVTSDGNVAPNFQTGGSTDQPLHRSPSRRRNVAVRRAIAAAIGGVALCMAQTAHAATTYTLKASDQFGSSSFDLSGGSSGGWSPTVNPSTDNGVDAFVVPSGSTFILRSPANGNATFGGGSLQIGNGTTDNTALSLKGTVNSGFTGVTVTVNNLILNGGLILVSNNPGIVETIAGNITLAAGSNSGFNPNPQNAVNALVVSAPISGNGSLTVNNGIGEVGGGAVTFTASNSYLGTTTVNAGSLSLGNGGTTGNLSASSAISIASGATLIFNHLNTLAQGTSFSSTAISGAGTIVQSGNGTTILNVANLYTGGTVISSGTLQVGNGTVNATLGTGTVTDSAALTFNSTSGGNSLSNVINGSGTVSQLGGVTTLSGASTYTGATTVSGGTLVASGAPVTGKSAIGNGNLTVAGGATFAYEPTAAGPLSVGTLTLNTGSTITAALGGTAGQSAITSTVNGAGGNYTVNIYGISGVSPAAGTNALITTTGGLGTGALGNIYNLSNYTVSGFTSSATGDTIIVTSASTLSSELWKGGFAGGTTVWAITDGSTSSNWATNLAGAATPLTPGNTTVVTFSDTAPVANATSTILGASMSIQGIVVNDSNGVGLNADGNTLTLGTSGIIVNSAAGAVSLAAPIILSGAQQWTNNSTSKALTVSGAVTNGGNTLTKTGAGALNISGAITGTGSVNVSAGTLTIASGGSLSGSNTLSIANVTTLNVASGGSVTVGTFSALGTSMTDNIAGNVTVTGGQSFIDGTTTQTGGTFTANDLEIATNGGGSGTYYLGGTGALTVGKGTYNALDVGQRGNGNFYVSQGGALTNTGVALVIGQNYSSATAANSSTFVQQGGTVSATGASNGNIFGVSLGAQNWSGNNADKNSSGTYYLNGGTLTTTGLTFGGSAFNLGSAFVFGGGMLKSSSDFTVAAVSSAVATTTINSGGAFIDTTSGNVTWNGNLSAGTTGNVVAPTSVTPLGSGYTTAPTVTIASTGGGSAQPPLRY